MKPLTGLDASFLHLETAEMPMHVGALHVLALPAGFKGSFIERLRAHIEQRLPQLAALRRRLGKVPLDLFNPVWEDAVPDLGEHIVSQTLPAGSGLRALEQAVAWLHMSLLPRDRPLWKFHVFEGLAPGHQGQTYVALYTQMHHAAVDGQAAVALASVILDLSPEPRALPERPARPPRAPLGAVGLLRGALAHQWHQTLRLGRALPAGIGNLAQLATQTAEDALQTWRQAPRKQRSGLAAPRTRFNSSVGRERRFASLSLPLAALNAARARHGASLNDALLMICSGALRRLLLELGELPRQPLVAAVPISKRAEGDSAASNQVSMTRVRLPTQIADPRRRLAQLLREAATMKRGMATMKALMPADFPSPGWPWLLGSAARLWGGAHLAEKLPPLVNLVISNVPGAPVPLYLAGARMLTNAPASIIVHGIALNLTVQSYAGQLELGLIADGAALDEAQALAFIGHLQAAYDELLALPAPRRAVAKATRSA